MGLIEMTRMIGFARDIFSNIIRDKRGSLATFVAAAALPLVAFTGLAVDTARGYLVKTRLSYALDSAALAGGRVMFDAVKRDAAIQDFFDANFPPGYMGANLTGPTTTINTTDQTIKLEATANVGTTLMQVLGVDDVDVAASAEVQRQVKGMELAMVLDNTGSMRHTAPGSSQSKVEDLKDASLQLVDILYAGREEIDDFYMSIVPYTAAVNIGNQHEGWLHPFVPKLGENESSNTPYPDGTQIGFMDSSYNYQLWADSFYPTTWKGCVEARTVGMQDRNDDPPSVNKFYPSRWPKTATSLDWPAVVETNESSARGPNANCADPIQPLIKAKTDIETVVNAMTYWRHGGTMGNAGLVWGWRTISPRWRGLWDGDDPADLPKDYLPDLVAASQPLSDKAVVMMTDGQNNIVSNHYSAYGMRQWNRLGSTTSSGTKAEINSRMLETCDLMKDEGVIIYTITFDTEGSTNQAVRDTYEDCATTPGHYFNSPGEDELTAAFIAIGTQLSNLRLAK
jgi:Flp pilus assembly protein TadG